MRHANKIQNIERYMKYVETCPTCIKECEMYKNLSKYTALGEVPTKTCPNILKSP